MNAARTLLSSGRGSLIRSSRVAYAPAVPQLTPEEAIAEARTGRLRPVYLLLGEERFFRQQVIAEMRRAVLGGDGPSLNEDQFTAGEADVRGVLAAAKTLPMFGSRRLVLLRALDRWEAKADVEGEAESEVSKSTSQKPLDQLADYATKASPSTTLLLVADKLDNRRRLVAAAKRDGFLVLCAGLPRHAVPSWIRGRARDQGHAMSPRAADLLAELVGADLSALCDALERVELFVGKGAELTEAAILQCVASLQPATVWDLVNAVGRRDTAAAVAALARVFEAGSGPRLLGLLAWSTRQLIRFSSARRQGLSADEAAQRAGVPPFKVREIADQAKQLPLPRAEAWLETLARLDLEVKGGVKLPQEHVLLTALIAFCRADAGARRASAR